VRLIATAPARRESLIGHKLVTNALGSTGTEAPETGEPGAGNRL
jgi:hypothetical protein